MSVEVAPGAVYAEEQMGLLIRKGLVCQVSGRLTVSCLGAASAEPYGRDSYGYAGSTGRGIASSAKLSSVEVPLNQDSRQICGVSQRGFCV